MRFYRIFWKSNRLWVSMGLCDGSRENVTDDGRFLSIIRDKIFVVSRAQCGLLHFMKIDTSLSCTLWRTIFSCWKTKKKTHAIVWRTPETALDRFPMVDDDLSRIFHRIEFITRALFLYHSIKTKNVLLCFVLYSAAAMQLMCTHHLAIFIRHGHSNPFCKRQIPSTQTKMRPKPKWAHNV